VTPAPPSQASSPGDLSPGRPATAPSYNPVMQIVDPDVESYLAALDPGDPPFARVAAEGETLRLPIVNPAVGRFLEMIVIATGTRRVLEIGTANGYSALWLARSLPPDGEIFTMEIDPERAGLARGHFQEIGLADRISVIVGDAARMAHKVAGPFDLIFNDGDKLQYGPLLDRLVSLLSPGGVLVTDNVLWDGEVVPGLVTPPRREPADTAAIAAYNLRLAADDRLATSFLPLRDGLAVSVRRRTS
jgi:predicted O-methyltransferase YrrM